MNEASFIDSLRALATDPAARGLMDDTAVLPVGAETLVLTHDMLVEGVHFLPGADMADIAWKLAATNLSDLAAKGAHPLGVLLGFMLDPKANGDDARFAEGLAEVLEHYGTPLLGGDTVSGGPPRSFGLTAIGQATNVPVPSRAGAKPGDAVYVTGALGLAMMGYEALRDGTGQDSTHYRRPMARLPEGEALAPFVTAMMDISDGLLLDAWRMAHASGVTIAIDSASVPIGAPEARRQDAIRWGDDYELLFALPEGIELPIPAYRIGAVQPEMGAPLLLDGQQLSDAGGLGYQHGEAARHS